MFTLKNKNFMNNYILHLRRKLFFYKTILHIPNLKTATKTSLRNGINFFFLPKWMLNVSKSSFLPD